jgi:hypothetical protein
MRFKKSVVLTECDRCSGKGVAGDSYTGRAPGYVSPTVEYGELTMIDDRGAEVEVGRDETAEEAIERLEAERERLHAEVELRIDEMIACVRRWDAGRPYPEQPAHSLWPSKRAEATMDRWKLTKAKQCAELLRPLLATWQYAEDVKERAHAVGFKPNAVERARQLLDVELLNRDGRSYWRLPETSDFRTSDDKVSEVGSSESVAIDDPKQEAIDRTPAPRIMARGRVFTR